MKIMTYIVINTEMYQNIRILTKIYKFTTMTDRRTDGQMDIPYENNDLYSYQY